LTSLSGNKPQTVLVAYRLKDSNIHSIYSNNKTKTFLEKLNRYNIKIPNEETLSGIDLIEYFWDKVHQYYNTNNEGEDDEIIQKESEPDSSNKKYKRPKIDTSIVRRSISEDGTNVTCICGSKIKLKCPHDEDYINQHVETYIEYTQLTATHGGAPPCHEMAHQLFPLVFPIGLKIKYPKLKSDQLECLEQELVNQSKCSPISRYITNSDVMQLIQQINNINLEAEESFWLKLAELDLITILSSLSTCAYNAFQKNLAGHEIQNIR
ncbi:6195_t:CDS:2, partial [Entrophospora sp. SA101]